MPASSPRDLLCFPARRSSDLAQASLEARRVHGALETLTPVQREAVELAYLGGYTHTEVASMLDLPVGRSEEHTSELQSHVTIVCRLLLEKKKGEVASLMPGGA